MSQQLVRVKVDGAEASVSEDFAEKYGLEVLDKPATTGRGVALPQKYPPAQLVSTDLKGAELNAQLETSGLSTEGTVKDKQARLAEFRQAQTAGVVGENGEQS